MPGRDGTGPAGQGAATGRGRGQCTGVNAQVETGRFGRSIGRFYQGAKAGWFSARSSKASNKETLLQEEKKILKNRVDAIDRILDKDR